MCLHPVPVLLTGAGRGTLAESPKIFFCSRFLGVIGAGGSETDVSTIKHDAAIPAKMELKNRTFSCTFPAQRCKSLIINGAGEGNRTLVFITDADLARIPQIHAENRTKH